MPEHKIARGKWLEFIDGHWTRTCPTKRGYYPLARNNGMQAGHGYAHHITDWDGWFWSEPMPMLPMPPIGTGEKEKE